MSTFEAKSHAKGATAISVMVSMEVGSDGKARFTFSRDRVEMAPGLDSITVTRNPDQAGNWKFLGVAVTPKKKQLPPCVNPWVNMVVTPFSLTSVTDDTITLSDDNPGQREGKFHYKVAVQVLPAGRQYCSDPVIINKAE
jgi:hypothetical protein